MRHRTRHPIQRAFTRAGLPLRVVGDCRDVNRRMSSSREIFAMDIVRRRRREEFVMAPGAAAVTAVNVDARRRQIVLHVGEDGGRMTVVADRYQRELTRWVLRPTPVEITVPSSRRHLLVGFDERHLFACRLPRHASTVADAHELLAPPSVRRDRAGVLRQGEWFFRRIDDVDADRELERAAREDGALHYRKAPLGHGLRLRGRPHVADHVVITSWSDDARRQSRGQRFGGRTGLWRSRTTRALGARELARGCVRHPDHRTLDLGRHWHVVERNSESIDAPPDPAMTWID